MSLIDTEVFEERTGKNTIGGAEMIIIMTPAGYYRIKADGPGAQPGICEDLFTNVREARKAVDLYQIDNGSRLATKAAMEEGIKRRKAAVGE